jgi:hypothetical protein
LRTGVPVDCVPIKLKVFGECVEGEERPVVQEPVAGELIGTVEDAGEEFSGDFVCSALLHLVALGEGEECFAHLRALCQESADPGELVGAPAVLEGVEVAPGSACAGSSAASSRGEFRARHQDTVAVGGREVEGGNDRLGRWDETQTPGIS